MLQRGMDLAADRWEHTFCVVSGYNGGQKRCGRKARSIVSYPESSSSPSFVLVFY